ncbi:DNA-3-methyladenine glycosylase family protein [Bosea robiniae]|uniref:DNA-3-methyladenine glycosylase family protein n=1 Tax=Bosea robiniae TaxID=1036780 RepID=UPI000B8985A9|nr:hypothetical protein [Bosea robiniae]
MDDAAFRHLRQAYPFLAPLFDDVGHRPVPLPQNTPVDEAVVKTVIGQMLSSKAAASIHARVVVACDERQCRAWDLPENLLRTAGLSGRKIRTIQEFGAGTVIRAEEIRAWPEMAFDDLRRSVSSFWGLSEWTAAILAIFHFGHVDVLPLSDGSIARAIKLIEGSLSKDARFDPEAARPYGTYLSMALWASLDDGYWKRSSMVVGEAGLEPAKA